MSEPIATPTNGDGAPAADGEMLQFDQAEFSTPSADRPTCSVCHQPIQEEYFEINQKVMCPRCRQGVEAAFRGGSPVARFLRATAFGMAAAAVGAAIYYAIVRITHWNIGLIAVALGIMVGTAVRKGTGNRGGRLYQFLALFLAYSSIVAMNVPLLIEALIDLRPDRPAAEVAAEKPGRGPRPAKVDPGAAVADAKKGAPVEVAAGQAGAGGDRANPREPSNPLYLLALVIGFFYAYPVLKATQAPISGLIYAFALWEAWKINKPIRLVFNGPFRLGEAGAAAVEPEGVTDGA
jgi:hypothetical protein